jgi:hypothetical protein
MIVVCLARSVLQVMIMACLWGVCVRPNAHALRWHNVCVAHSSIRSVTVPVALLLCCGPVPVHPALASIPLPVPGPVLCACVVTWAGTVTQLGLLHMLSPPQRGGSSRCARCARCALRPWWALTHRHAGRCVAEAISVVEVGLPALTPALDPSDLDALQRCVVLAAAGHCAPRARPGPAMAVGTGSSGSGGGLNGTSVSASPCSHPGAAAQAWMPSSSRGTGSTGSGGHAGTTDPALQGVTSPQTPGLPGQGLQPSAPRRRSQVHMFVNPMGNPALRTQRVREGSDRK